VYRQISHTSLAAALALLAFFSLTSASFAFNIAPVFREHAFPKGHLVEIQSNWQMQQQMQQQQMWQRQQQQQQQQQMMEQQRRQQQMMEQQRQQQMMEQQRRQQQEMVRQQQLRDQQRQQEQQRQMQQRQDVQRQQQQRQMDTTRQQQQRQMMEQQQRRLAEQQRARMSGDSWQRNGSRNSVLVRPDRAYGTSAIRRDPRIVPRANGINERRNETARLTAQRVAANRIPTLGEMRRAFRGKILNNGMAVVTIRGKTWYVRASRIGVAIPLRAGATGASASALQPQMKLKGAGGGSGGKGGGRGGANDNNPPDDREPKRKSGEPPRRSIKRGNDLIIAARSSASNRWKDSALKELIATAFTGEVHNKTKVWLQLKKVANEALSKAVRLPYGHPDSLWNSEFVDSDADLKSALDEFEAGTRGASVKDLDLTGLSLAEMEKKLSSLGFKKDTTQPYLLARGECGEGVDPCYRKKDGNATPHVEGEDLARQDIWVYFDKNEKRDGGVVRIKPDGEPRVVDPLRPDPHFVKYVQRKVGSDLGFHNEGFKVSTEGIPVPRLPSDPNAINKFYVNSNKKVLTYLADEVSDVGHTNFKP